MFAFFPPFTYFQFYQKFYPGVHPNSQSNAIFESLDKFTRYYIQAQYRTYYDQKRMAHVYHIEEFSAWVKTKLSPHAYKGFMEFWTADTLDPTVVERHARCFPREFRNIQRLANKGNINGRWAENGRWHEPFPEIYGEQMLYQRWHWTTPRTPETPLDHVILWVDRQLMWIDDHTQWLQTHPFVQNHPWLALGLTVVSLGVFSYYAINYFWPPAKIPVEPSYNSAELANVLDVYNQIFDKLPQGAAYRSSFAGWKPWGWKWKIERWEYTVWEPYFTTFARVNKKALDLTINFYKNFGLLIYEHFINFTTLYYQPIALGILGIYTVSWLKRRTGILLLPYFYQIQQRARVISFFLFPWWIYWIALVGVLIFTAYLFNEFPHLLDPTLPYYTINNELMWSPTIDSHLQNFELYYQYATARAWYQTRTSIYMKYPFVPNDWPVVGEVAKFRTPLIKENNMIQLSDGAAHVYGNAGLKDTWIFEKWEKRRPKLGRLNLSNLTYQKLKEPSSKLAAFEAKLSSIKTASSLTQENFNKKFSFIQKLFPFPAHPVAPDINNYLNKNFYLFFVDYYNYLEKYLSFPFEINAVKEKRTNAWHETYLKEFGFYGEKYKPYAQFIASDNYWFRDRFDNPPESHKIVKKSHTFFRSVYRETKYGMIERPYWNEITINELAYRKSPQVTNFHKNRADEFIITRNPYKQFDIVGYSQLKTWAKVLKTKGVQQALALEFIEKNSKRGVFNDLAFMKGPIKLHNGLWWDWTTHIFNKIDYLDGVAQDTDSEYNDDENFFTDIHKNTTQYFDYLKNDLSDSSFLKFKKKILADTEKNFFINEKSFVAQRQMPTLPDFYQVLTIDPVVFEKMLHQDPNFIIIGDNYKIENHNKGLNYYPNIIFEYGTETEKDKIHLVTESEFLKYVKRKSLKEPSLNKKIQAFLEAKTIDDRIKLKVQNLEQQQWINRIRGFRKQSWEDGEDDEYLYALNKLTEFNQLNKDQARRTVATLNEPYSNIIKKRDIFPTVISKNPTTENKIFMDAQVWWKNFTHQKPNFLNPKTKPDSLMLLKKTTDITNTIFFPEPINTLSDKIITKQANLTIIKLFKPWLQSALANHTIFTFISEYNPFEYSYFIEEAETKKILMPSEETGGFVSLNREEIERFERLEARDKKFKKDADRLFNSLLEEIWTKKTNLGVTKTCEEEKIFNNAQDEILKKNIVIEKEQKPEIKINTEKKGLVYISDIKTDLLNMEKKVKIVEQEKLKKWLKGAKNISNTNDSEDLKKVYNHLGHKLNEFTAKMMAHEEKFPLPLFVSPPAASAAFRQYFINTMLHHGYLEELLDNVELYRKNYQILFIPGSPAQIYPHVFYNFNEIFEENNALGSISTLKELCLQDEVTSLWTKTGSHRQFLKITGGDLIEHAWIREQRFAIFHNYPYIWELWFWQIVVFIFPIISFFYYFVVEETWDFDRYNFLSIMDKQEKKLPEKITKLL